MSEHCSSIEPTPGGARHTLEPPAAPAERAVEPRSDQGAGDDASGRGWRREQIVAVAEDLDDSDCPKDAAAVRALLADRDRLDAEATSWKARLVNETEHLRARYAKLYDDARDERATLRHERDNARHNLRQALDDWAADAKQLTAERDGVRAELARMADDLADRDATLAMRTVQLRDARRDAAADALDWAAAEWERRNTWPGISDLAAWAADVRAGTRTIPPTDRQ